jgi:hypothetical protein
VHHTTVLDRRMRSHRPTQQWPTWTQSLMHSAPCMCPVDSNCYSCVCAGVLGRGVGVLAAGQKAVS